MNKNILKVIKTSETIYEIETNKVIVDLELINMAEDLVNKPDMRPPGQN